MEATFPQSVVVLGAGPAGLMAAEVLSRVGVSVVICEAMPTAGRKFLMAGRGGLNLTHSEPLPLFLSRFQHGLNAPIPALQSALRAFPPDAVRAWADGLGAETFVGSSGRVFPKAMKAAPLLRAWLRRLAAQGVELKTRHRWVGWQREADRYRLEFETPTGRQQLRAHHVVLALGGASWPRLGSDGAWLNWMAAAQIPVAPFRPANVGFEVSWSDHLRQRHAGEPLKQVTLTYRDAATGVAQSRRGDCVVSHYGIEGGVVYALSSGLRDALARDGTATVLVDLLPQRSEEDVCLELSAPRGGRSWGSFLQSRLGLKGVKRALLNENLPNSVRAHPSSLAAWIKAVPVTLTATRPLAEAISSAGGLGFAALDAQFQLKSCPGVFCAGEMLDWEAPTGGYLLSACLATGHAAAQGLLRTLEETH